MHRRAERAGRLHSGSSKTLAAARSGSENLTCLKELSSSVKRLNCCAIGATATDTAKPSLFTSRTTMAIALSTHVSATQLTGRKHSSASRRPAKALVQAQLFGTTASAISLRRAGEWRLPTVKGS